MKPVPRCPRPNCGGSLLREWDDRRLIKVCLLCSRNPDKPKPLPYKHIILVDERALR